MVFHKKPILKFIFRLQLFIASGLCIYFSNQDIAFMGLINNLDKFFHLVAFFIYGLSLQYFLVTFKINKQKIIMLTIWIGFLFALSDEIHQNFVDGRNCDIVDLLFDWVGISISIFFNKYIFLIWAKINL